MAVIHLAEVREAALAALWRDMAQLAESTLRDAFDAAIRSSKSSAWKNLTVGEFREAFAGAMVGQITKMRT
jgi:hypothetical protein